MMTDRRHRLGGDPVPPGDEPDPLPLPPWPQAQAAEAPVADSATTGPPEIPSAGRESLPLPDLPAAASAGLGDWERFTASDAGFEPVSLDTHSPGDGSVELLERIEKSLERIVAKLEEML